MQVLQRDRFNAMAVFPAPAGMNRIWLLNFKLQFSVPRARGDEPSEFTSEQQRLTCSPRPRG